MKALLVISVFLSFSVKAVDLNTVMEKVKAVYSQKNMSYTTKYSLYKGHKSTTVHSSYEGEIYAYNSLLYQKIGKSEFLYGSDYFLHISHEEKAMVLGEPQKTMQQQVDLSQVLAECKNSEIIDKGDYYKIAFFMKTTSGIPCSVVKIRVDKKNYTLLRMDLYYSYFEDYSEEFGEVDMHQPHIKIEFGKVNFNPSERKELFELSQYLTQSNSVYTPTGTCKGYELIDQRI